MSIVILSAALRPADSSMGQVRYDMVEVSDATGAESARLFGPPRWALNIVSSDNMKLQESGLWKSLLLQLRGRVNHLYAYNPAQRQPVGTLRGSPRLAAAVAVGDTSMTLIGGTNGTVLEGDMYQIASGLGSSQVVAAVADAVSNPATNVPFVWSNGGVFSWTNGGAFSWSDMGTIVITFEPPARYAYAKDATVVWDHPRTYYRLQSESVRWKPSRGATGREGGYVIDLLEAFS
jgi:hypothetical protein